MMITKIAEILGVSEDSLKAMPEDIIGAMTAVFESIEVKNDDDAKMLYAELDSYWTKGSILLGLKEVAANTGIEYSALCGLDADTQQELVFEYMADSGNTSRLYEITNKALAVIELEKVAELINVPIETLKEYPQDTQEQLCGIYSMEYDADDNSFELINRLRGVIGV